MLENINITREQWYNRIVLLQEKFLLLRWRRNTTCYFSRWLKARLLEKYRNSDYVPRDEEI